MTSVLLEARSFRPFKSSEEYLYAMKEDLAEWLQTMYPHLNICVENFMERLETGVAMCEHANAVKAQAQEYAMKKRAKKIMTRSTTGSLAMAHDLVHISEVKFFNTAKPGTFFARDNVSNFINWCRNALKIIECLLFESDDLIMRKNEKHVILCLLEVARRGAKFGMLAPMLVQMERQIDREIAADQKKLSMMFNENTENHTKFDDDSDSDMEDEETVLMYGPVPQIITNDLKCLDDMVRDLVEQCTCPTQFPMIRVSDGKYRIGDTKVLIFVRVLRNHVMVRVGGGWDTLAHYLDKHDPCRCRSQHRTTQGAKLTYKTGSNDLHGSHVYYNRAPATIFDPTHHIGGTAGGHSLGPPMNSLNRSRSRSPSHLPQINSRRSASPNTAIKHLIPLERRSRSPTPNFTSTYMTKLSTNPTGGHHQKNSGPHSLPIMSSSPKSKHISSLQIDVDSQLLKSEATLHVNDTDQSDSTSEMSDEGYRSLGIIQDKNKYATSLNQHSIDVVDNEHHQIYTGDELNDCGLRKTQFSQIYQNDIKGKLENNLNSVETLSEPHKQQSNNTMSPKPKDNISSRRKERSFVGPGSPKMYVDGNRGLNSLSVQKKSESKLNTWSGRPKNTRHSLTTETFISPFVRNSTGRRSTSAVNYDRRSSSANSSPTKSRLKQELLEAVKQTDDDTSIVEHVQELLKRYKSFTTLDDDAFETRRPTRNGVDNTYISPRKDSRPDNNMSRIPAPKFYSKT